MGKGYNSERQQLEVECIMKYTNQKVPYITMEELNKLQKDYMFFDKILKKAENKKKKTPGNGFVIHNCKEKMKPMMMMFDAIDQGKVLIADYD